MRIRERLLTAFILGLIFGSSLTWSAEPKISGWQEAVLSVSSIDNWINQWTDAAGYQVVHRGELDKAWLSAWQLPAKASATEALLRNPGTESGYLRLIEFRGVPQRQMRSNGSTWESGGWFDVNVRVVDLDVNFRKLQSMGWSGFADPVELVFGPFVVKEWLARGPDGVVFALIERVEPPLENWPRLKNISRLFNSTQIVSDMDAAYDFYINTLGFKVYLESDGPSEKPGPNVLGLPHNLADKIARHVYIVHPDGTNEGSVELIEFDGLTGRDFSAHTRAPNLGVLLLRFPVDNVDALAARLANEDVEIVSPPRRLNLAPTGERMVFTARGPNGEWLEFFEQ